MCPSRDGSTNHTLKWVSGWSLLHLETGPHGKDNRSQHGGNVSRLVSTRINSRLQCTTRKYSLNISDHQKKKKKKVLIPLPWACFFGVNTGDIPIFFVQNPFCSAMIPEHSLHNSRNKVRRPPPHTRLQAGLTIEMSNKQNSTTSSDCTQRAITFQRIKDPSQTEPSLFRDVRPSSPSHEEARCARRQEARGRRAARVHERQLAAPASRAGAAHQGAHHGTCWTALACRKEINSHACPLNSRLLRHIQGS